MLVRSLAAGENIRPLVDAYVQEVAGRGGEIPHTDEAINAIVEAMSRGVCLVAGTPAVAWTAAIDCTMPWPTIYGKMAIGLGTYVAPEHRRQGIAKSLRLALQEKLTDMGYDTLIGSVHTDNKAGRESLVEEIGFTPYQTLGYRRLR